MPGIVHPIKTSENQSLLLLSGDTESEHCSQMDSLINFLMLETLQLLSTNIDFYFTLKYHAHSTTHIKDFFIV